MTGFISRKTQYYSELPVFLKLISNRYNYVFGHFCDNKPSIVENIIFCIIFARLYNIYDSLNHISASMYCVKVPFAKETLWSENILADYPPSRLDYSDSGAYGN